jgi:hypothetical protein
MYGMIDNERIYRTLRASTVHLLQQFVPGKVVSDPGVSTTFLWSREICSYQGNSRFTVLLIPSGFDKLEQIKVFVIDLGAWRVGPNHPIPQ